MWTIQGCINWQFDPWVRNGRSVVVDLISELCHYNKYFLNFDNCFTSLKLMDYLQKVGFRATSTIRQNRVENAPLKYIKKFSKQARGSIDYIQDSTTCTLLVRWRLLVFFVYPTSEAKRWSNKEKKTITVEQPPVIVAYNKYMEGVDRVDQNVATYRIRIRSKKWWWPLFIFCLSVSFNNACQLYRHVLLTTRRSWTCWTSLVGL